jgi:hypothetical protein
VSGNNINPDLLYRARATAKIFSIPSGNWIFNFMVVMITPVAFANIQWKTYVIFAVM